MARIDASSLEHRVKERVNVHPVIDGTYFSFNNNGTRYFQIDTYGSSNRECPGKTSQTIQFDKETAKTLISIIQKELNL